MFTGIIEEIGRISGVKREEKFSVLKIQAKKVLEGTKVGDSIAVNGVCLTVTKKFLDGYEADVMAETLRRSNLGTLRPGSLVNLEQALTLNARLGGHLVSGHIDGTGTITQLKPEGNAMWITIAAGEEILRYVVQKGSITIDGISLTVAAIDETSLKVSVIPHTGQETILLQKQPKDTVNLECDVLAKYVEKLMKTKSDVVPKKSGLSEAFLMEHGFIPT